MTKQQVRAGWDRARLAGLVEIHGDNARAGWRLHAWDRDDSAVLRGWVALFDAWSLVHPAREDVPPGDVAEVVEAVPQLLSLLQLSAGPVAVPALLDLLRQRVEELRGERFSSAPRTPVEAAPAAEGMPALLAWALEGLAAIGALTLGEGPDGSQATLTSLGNWAVWVKLEQICVAAQSPAGNIEQSAEDMLRRSARLTPGPARSEYRAWLAARALSNAITELIAVARGEDALLRGLAFEVLRIVGAGAEAEVQAATQEASLRPYALLWLAEQDGADPDDALDVLTREEATWLWVDVAAAILDYGESELLVRHLDSAVQETVPALLMEAKAVGHPRTVQVLVGLAAAHPDPALAKAIRRAAFQVHSQTSQAHGTGPDTSRAQAEAAKPGILPPESTRIPHSPADETSRRRDVSDSSGGSIWEPRFLEAELVAQAPPRLEVPLHVRVTRDSNRPGALLQGFPIPQEGARLLITVHAPGLLALGDLQQELDVPPGRDSGWLHFGLRTTSPGLHTVTVRAFHKGTFLGELQAQISVQSDTPARDGQPHRAPLTTLAFDPGEVSLQVLKGNDGTYSFQLVSETAYAPEPFRLVAGDFHNARERIYDELRSMAVAAGRSGGNDAVQSRRRLMNLGVQLWAAAVPDAVRQQFWEESAGVSALTVIGEHDLVPWELLYPLDGQREGDGFLAEWLPVVRRVFKQDRVRELPLPQATFVVPPDSPPEAQQEVTALRARLGNTVADGGTLTRRSAVSDLIDGGLQGLLHFACHNTFTGAGSRVTMADGPFDPIDLAYATQSESLRSTRPTVFFNACRSAGQIDWFSAALGWAPQFLKAGAGAFIGTLWPVRSDSALLYADTFYEHLVAKGQTLGEASLNARRAIRDQGGDPTWLAYTVYGSPAARATCP